MLHSIQAYRGIAVLLVVLFHGTYKIEHYYGVAPFFGVFDYGFSGVHLFFVLSGFVILAAHIKDIGFPKKLFGYFKRRLIRIYPIYWLIFLVLGGWKLISINVDVETFLIYSFLFVSEENFVIPVAWTLLHEIIFYTVFSALIINKKLGVITITAWFVLILLNWNDPSIVLFHRFNLLFIFGLLAAILCRKFKRIDDKKYASILKIFFPLGVLGFLVTSVYYSGLNVNVLSWQSHPVSIIGFGFASFLLILSSASSEIEAAFKHQRILRLIGDASYSIYLVHLWSLSEFFKLIRSLTERTTGIILNDGMGQSLFVSSVLLSIIVILSVLVGLIVHLKVEQPLLQLLRKKFIK